MVVTPACSGSERAHRSQWGQPGKPSQPDGRQQMSALEAETLPGWTAQLTWYFTCLTTGLNSTGVRQDLPRSPLSPTPYSSTHTHTQLPVPHTPHLVMTSNSFPFSPNCLSSSRGSLVPLHFLPKGWCGFFTTEPPGKPFLFLYSLAFGSHFGQMLCVFGPLPPRFYQIVFPYCIVAVVAIF